LPSAATVLDEHRGYLADTNRVAAYEAAVAATVRPGVVVVDLGAGSGVLGILACRAGARRVYVVEALATMELARRLYQASGFAERAVFLRGWSSSVTIPEPADVVLCDQVGYFGVGAGLLGSLADARRRFLRSGGTIVPQRLAFELGAVDAKALGERVQFWLERPVGLDLSPVHRLAANAPFPAALRPSMLLGPPVRGLDLDLAGEPPQALSLAVRLTIERAGVLHGLAGWVVATLAPGISMTNDPRSPTRIDRPGLFLPLERAVEVAPGDEIAAHVILRAADDLLAWRVEVSGPGQPPHARFSHSSFSAMLLSREDLARQRPDWAPRLSSSGQAERLVLELVDGQRTRQEIEAELARRHAALFPEPRQAAAFVAQVLARSTSLEP